MRQSELETLIADLFRLMSRLLSHAWRWRLEIGCAAVPYVLASRVTGDPVLALLAVALLGLAFARGLPFLEARRRAAGRSRPRLVARLRARASLGTTLREAEGACDAERARPRPDGVTRFPEYAYLRRDPCAYCGGAGGTIDHIVPRARGGAPTDLNLTGACDQCGGLKAQWPLLIFLLLRDWA